MFSNFYWLDSHNKTGVTLSIIELKSDFPYVSKGYCNYMFANSLTEYIDPAQYVHCWVWNN